MVDCCAALDPKGVRGTPTNSFSIADHLPAPNATVTVGHQLDEFFQLVGRGTGDPASEVAFDAGADGVWLVGESATAGACSVRRLCPDSAFSALCIGVRLRSSAGVRLTVGLGVSAWIGREHASLHARKDQSCRSAACWSVCISAHHLSALCRAAGIRSPLLFE